MTTFYVETKQDSTGGASLRLIVGDSTGEAYESLWIPQEELAQLVDELYHVYDMVKWFYERPHVREERITFPYRKD